MQVREIMTENPACCSPQSSLKEVAQMMTENDCGCIPVVEDWKTMRPLGAITDRDIAVRAFAKNENPLDLKAKDIMTSDVITVAPETSVEECFKTMADNQIRRILVVDENDSCCGIVAQADVAEYASPNQTANVVKEISDASNGVSSLWKGNGGKSAMSGSSLLALPVGVGLGAALMYFLDPERGRRRRAMVGDQVASLTDKAQKTLGKTQKELKKHAKEFAAEAGKKSEETSKQNANQTAVAK